MMATVGTKKVFENDRVSVWEMNLEPGESTGVHTHDTTYFFQVIEGSTLRTLDKDGNSYGDIEAPAGETFWIEIEGDEAVLGDLRVPATHEAVNVGPNTYREILVEMK